MLQVLQKRWDPTFAEHSYGFTPGRSVHQALVAQEQHHTVDCYNVVGHAPRVCPSGALLHVSDGSLASLCTLLGHVRQGGVD